MTFPLRWRVLIIVSLLLFMVTTVRGILVDRIAGVVDGEIINYSDVQIERLFGLSEGGDREILQGLIDRRLLLREAEKFKITDNEEDTQKIQQRLQDIKGLLGEEPFHNVLKEYSLTESDILKMLKDKIITEKFIDFRINFFVVISNDVIKAYYNEHKDEFGDRTLEEASSQIKGRLFQIESKRRSEDYLSQLRKKAKISVNIGH